MHQRRIRKTLLPSASSPGKRGLEEDELFDLGPEELDFGGSNLEAKQEQEKPPLVPSPAKRVRIAPEGPSPGRGDWSDAPPQPSFAYRPDTPWGWEDTVVMLVPRPAASTTQQPLKEVSAFAFESTLVKRRPCRTLTPASDWEFCYPEVPSKLRQLAHSRRLVIFTHTDVANLEHLRKRAIGFVNMVGVPVEVYASVMPDHRRMPSRALWDVMLKRSQGGPAEGGTFCGSEAGREGDASARDRRFAANCSAHFTTPEEEFLGEAPQAFTMPLSPARGRDGGASLTPEAAEQMDYDYTNKGDAEVVILVGYPGAGKSTFVRRHLLPHGYNHVNQDRLGSVDKCVSMVQSALERGQRVVVDNTNPSQATRALYTRVAKRYPGVVVRCFWFNTSRATAQRLNKVRSVVSEGAAVLIPQDAYDRYDATFSAPSMDEDLSEIRAVHFEVAFESQKHSDAFNDANA